jgi:hypothetical protein
MRELWEKRAVAQEVPSAKTWMAGVPAAGAPPGGRVTDAMLLPAASVTVSLKMLPLPL